MELNERQGSGLRVAGWLILGLPLLAILTLKIVSALTFGDMHVGVPSMMGFYPPIPVTDIYPVCAVVAGALVVALDHRKPTWSGWLRLGVVVGVYWMGPILYQSWIEHVLHRDPRWALQASGYLGLLWGVPCLIRCFWSPWQSAALRRSIWHIALMVWVVASFMLVSLEVLGGIGPEPSPPPVHQIEF